MHVGEIVFHIDSNTQLDHESLEVVAPRNFHDLI